MLALVVDAAVAAAMQRWVPVKHAAAVGGVRGARG